MKKTQKGFTLIEILVVIGIIAILAAVVIVAINPSRQFAQAHNSQRQSNVTAILDAIGQNIADNKGVFTCSGVTINGTPTDIAKSGVDLRKCLVPTYLPEIGFDPTTGNNTCVDTTPGDCAGGSPVGSYDTKYMISMTTTNRYVVSASNAELGQTISVTR